MTDDFRQLLAAIGRCLIAIASEDAAQAKAPATAEPKPEPAAQTEPQPEPAPMKGKRAPMPRKEKTCIVCGAAYLSASSRSLLCPHCRILRVNGNAKFKVAFEAAKANLQGTAPAPQPVADGKIRCERMHATIPATICGTREECRGCPQRSAA